MIANPNDLTDDQFDFLAVLGQLGVLAANPPIDEDVFLDLSGQALDVFQARGLVLRGETKPTIETLAKYRKGFLKDGYKLAADGVALLELRWFAEVERKAADAPRN